ncbi:hypothetical protein QQP08_027674 [Theobroma cacao]|uniref:Uncharacterized protein LOC18588232 n=1 Tax=Theobroma cacao TaxID=3641 RepID=A0AB32WRS1_THECC|nr:PREDICTED: uncharacterized protein LOC18588232 [Theobroma cacao]WRX35187.1 hypothetical protein QQP08_027674 [Theobroma cacao]
MNVLVDSQLEALAFNYVSFGIFTIVNNLWTWVAVITAAVSFWRIRAASAATPSCSVKKPDQKPSKCVIDRAQDESQPIPEAIEKPTPSALVSAPAGVMEMSVSSPLVCHDAVTKGGKFKLTVYSEDDGDSHVDGEMTVTEWSDIDGDCKEWSCGGWWQSWERVLSVRKGETGWYRYQDLTAINGNVVRLWDECRR